MPDTLTGPVMLNGQPNPSGTGPYCAPLRCYCRSCPGYAEQKAAADEAFKREVRAAKSKLAAREDARFRR